MKAYTDLEQSKVLAEILPLESADMGWYYTNNPNAARNQMWVGTKAENADIPCWSLSALLDVLPNNEHIETTISRGGWKIDPVEYLPNTWWCGYEDTKNQTEFNISADNIVDACYKMVLKLHELNLL